MNRIQNLRKEKGFELTDKISLMIKNVQGVEAVVSNFKEYICTEVLAKEIIVLASIKESLEVEVDGKLITEIAIEKV